MRYRDTGDYENLGTPVGDDLLLFTIIFSVFLGIGFVLAGRHVKRYWMVIWGSGLVVASLSYFVMKKMGYH